MAAVWDNVTRISTESDKHRPYNRVAYSTMSRYALISLGKSFVKRRSDAPNFVARFGHAAALHDKKTIWTVQMCAGIGAPDARWCRDTIYIFVRDRRGSWRRRRNSGTSPSARGRHSLIPSLAAQSSQRPHGAEPGAVTCLSLHFDLNQHLRPTRECSTHCNL
jgi:hypothetical protein